MATYYVKTTGNDTTGDGSSGNPWASPGKAVGSMAVDDVLYIEEGTYTITSSTPNIAGGRISMPANLACTIIGHATGDITDFSAKPTISAGALSTISIIVMDGADAELHIVFNVRVDGEGHASVQGFNGTSYNNEFCINCEAIDCGTNGFESCTCFNCKSSFTGTPTGFGFNACAVSYCWADNHANGLAATGMTASHSIFSNCTNGVQDSNTYRARFINCVAYNCANSGFALRNAATLSGAVYVNCIAYGNGSYGWDFNVLSGSGLINCAAGDNATARTDGNAAFDLNPITLTADPFTNAAAGDFSLNNTAGGGALLRSLGYGIPGQTQNIDIGAVQHADAGGSSKRITSFIG